MQKLLKVSKILGIFLEEPEVFIFDIKQKYIKENKIDILEVEHLMKLRQEAKLEKNYKLSDELRAKLEEKGVLIQDIQGRSEWDIKELYIG